MADVVLNEWRPQDRRSPAFSALPSPGRALLFAHITPVVHAGGPDERRRLAHGRLEHDGNRRAATRGVDLAARSSILSGEELAEQLAQPLEVLAETVPPILA